jgi:hypothetical protein
MLVNIEMEARVALLLTFWTKKNVMHHWRPFCQQKVNECQKTVVNTKA